MLFYIKLAAAFGVFITSSFKLYKTMNESVIIKKREFENIEKRIRLDERRKVICQLQKK